MGLTITAGCSIIKRDLGEFLFQIFCIFFCRKFPYVRFYYNVKFQCLNALINFLFWSFITTWNLGFQIFCIIFFNNGWPAYISSNNLTPAIFRVAIGWHLIFCSPKWPTCCNSPRKWIPVKARQKAGFSIVR